MAMTSNVLLTSRRSSAPITIHVFANTPSERELHRGDVIVAINGRDTSNLTHKQAQDAISGGGGQIEFLVQRPFGNITIKPLTPATDTRAPSLPQSPTRAPQITIPIQRKQGPQSPTRTIPISPQKPSPPKPATKLVQHTEPNRDMSAGFMPKKVTLNKFGGGGPDFGSAYGGVAGHRPPQTQYRPVAAPVPARDQYDYGGQPQQQQQHQQQSYQQQQTFQSQTQFSAPQSPPVKQPEERGVEEEDYGSVNERRRNFMKGAPQPPNALGSDEDDYPTAPVWERRKIFGKQRGPPPAIQRSRKPTPSFGRARAQGDSSYTTFGVDYTKPQPQQQPKPTSSRPRPPAVNARRDDDEMDGQPWSNTLRGESKMMKPWEREALEAERYQSATVDQPYRPHMHSPQPPTAPKPKIVQISAQSTVRQDQHSPSAAYRSVSPTVPPKPYRSQAPPPETSPYQSPTFQHLSPNAALNDVSGSYGQAGQAPNVVHLQYNSPIGLYSNANVMDSYVGQTKGRALSPSQPKKPPVPGERDWNDSFVYQMIHSSEKTTSSNYSDGTGQKPQGETVTTSRVAHETKYPGQEPQRRVTETVQRSGVPDYKFDSAIGMSDF
ncbi:serine/arginine repetitive matrix protein 1-like isoform X3 [Ruditapes philippinarum]|uniref:serine/arginine repetitive matrix protein 1-like isoform X3 n=1 Tax=Ruditapes philippinarum TaxID=129788 RepID=UPI00295BEB5D|nr:serine/arginine repetitive matrix protein 1-like isoform X3 [Ruditapes philippinarum]